VVEGLYDAKYLDFGFNVWLFWIGMLAIAAAGFVYQPKGPVDPGSGSTPISPSPS
jgi:hypothetical protein